MEFKIHYFVNSIIITTNGFFTINSQIILRLGAYYLFPRIYFIRFLAVGEDYKYLPYLNFIIIITTTSTTTTTTTIHLIPLFIKATIILLAK